MNCGLSSISHIELKSKCSTKKKNQFTLEDKFEPNTKSSDEIQKYKNLKVVSE